MPKIPPRIARSSLLRRLERIRDREDARHRVLVSGDGSVPVGGAHMDPFFRAEGLRVTIRAIRDGKTIAAAIRLGQDASSEAIRKWNSRREWQVHRWDRGAWDFIYNSVRYSIDAEDKPKWKEQFPNDWQR